MEKETITYEGIKYYPLLELDRYYGSMDGRVLSLKGEKPKLLRQARLGNSEIFYIRALSLNKITRPRVAYMVQNGLKYSQLGKKAYTILPSGQAVCTSLAELCRIMVRKRDESRKSDRDPRKWIAEGKRMIKLTEHYLATGDMKGFADEAEKHKGFVVAKLTTAFHFSKRTATGITDEAISETLWNISRGLVVFNMADYILSVAKRMVKMSKSERKKLVGLTYDPADCEYDEF